MTLLILLWGVISLFFFNNVMFFVCGYLFCYYLFITSFYLMGLEGIKGDLFMMFGCDYVSFYMMMLSFWLCMVIIGLWGLDLYVLGLIIMLIFFINLFFSSMEMMLFFLFFEICLIPLFIIIVVYSVSSDRYISSLYMVIYTLIGSLPALVALMYIYINFSSLLMDYLFYYSIYFNGLFSYIVLMMFLVKIPMFMVHIWLPKAHVEAPVFGSMILASLMLKLGGYGILRYFDMFMFSCMINDLFVVVGLLGGFMVGLICLYQIDLKILVAYSSVIHMCMMTGGIFSDMILGYKGGLMMMLVHGICSPCMFYMVNMLYERSFSRLIYFNKGVGNCLPMFCLLWAVLLMNNLGVPPSSGIVVEVFLLGAVMCWDMSVLLIIILLIFFISFFVMNMYLGLMGMVDQKLIWSNIMLKDYYGIIIFFIPMNMMIIFLYGLF